MVRTRSPVQIRLSAPYKGTQRWVPFCMELDFAVGEMHLFYLRFCLELGVRKLRLLGYISLLDFAVGEMHLEIFIIFIVALV